jgi:ATP dependent DNA ligase-like protein
MARPLDGRRRSETMAFPGWIKPQLTKLVDQAPDGPDWLHEIKFDGYRMHARLDRGAVRLLTRTGLDWTPKYPTIAAAAAALPARQAYLDGELCGVRPDGTTSFSLIQNASDTGNSGSLVFFLFDLLHLDGETIAPLPVTERKERLRGEPGFSTSVGVSKPAGASVRACDAANAATLAPHNVRMTAQYFPVMTMAAAPDTSTHQDHRRSRPRLAAPYSRESALTRIRLIMD